MSHTPFHKPVLLNEVIKALNCNPSGIYVDGTIGGGGHSREILKSCAPFGKLIGIDCDGQALALAKKNLEVFKDRLYLIKSDFVNIEQILKELNINELDGILLDLGASSYQIEDGNRGFSFIKNGPLDMRMDRSYSLTASQIVNEFPPERLKSILKFYGEERWANKITSGIIRAREKREILTTTQLAEIVTNAIPKKSHPKKIHPATRTFQAFRIAVNRELEKIEEFIRESVTYLKKKGRIVIITFHSLEDRIVKFTYKSLSNGCNCPPYFPECICKKEKQVTILTSKPIIPSTYEIRDNPRARSAKLRVCEKI
ncbi:MAG: 16S rRNA (cytosine(1402)-N(4))-methyltransferase RsmH [Thermodesulfobacteriota bacterium]|nr:16S rRNA (cytosine(1402)-N(4))-methyltransferase RsmH [Thermodesulfobacteriota bacterium]